MNRFGDGKSATARFNGGASRFGTSVSGKEVSVSASARNRHRPLNTVRNDAWALKIWQTWANYRNSLAVTGSESVSAVPVNLKRAVIGDVLFWMPRFIMEARAGDGKDYSPESLKSIVYAIYRYLKEECNYAGPSFVGHNTEAGLVLDSRVKELREASGILAVRHSDPILAEDEKMLWERDVVNLFTSQGILNAVFVYTGKLFGIRNSEQHRLLLREQILLKTDSAGQKYVEFWPTFVKKSLPQTGKRNHELMGVSEIVEEVQIRREPIKHYDDVNNPRSYVKILDTYYQFSKETKGTFYRRALSHAIGTPPKFSLSPLGINNLGQMLKSMFSLARIDMKGRNITTRSLTIRSAMDMPNSVMVDDCSAEKIEKSTDECVAKTTETSIDDSVSEQKENIYDAQPQVVLAPVDKNEQVDLIMDIKPKISVQEATEYANEYTVYCPSEGIEKCSSSKAELKNGLSYSLSVENDKMCLHVSADTQVMYSASSYDGGKRLKFCFETV